jgi:biopolymer transport protein ExbD
MSRRSFRLKIAESIEEPIVNLTPLIDVVFVILIAFIVIAPLLELDRVELAEAGIANEKTASVQETSPITIHVKQDNSIWFAGHPVSINELTSLLTQAKIRHPHSRPQLFHDKHAAFGIYQSVKNAAETAGFEQLDVILKPA